MADRVRMTDARAPLDPRADVDHGVGRLQPWLFAAAVAAPFLTCVVLAGFRESVQNAVACLLLVLIVVAVAAGGDRFAGLVAALSSGTWFNFFLTVPYSSFVIDDVSNIATTVLLVLIGAGVTELSLWGRRHQARASVRAGYLDGVLSAAELISAHDQPPAVLAAQVARRIAGVLGVAECRFVTASAHDPRHAVLQPDGTVMWRGHPVNVDRHGLPSLEETVVLVRRGPVTLGYFVVFSAGRVAYPSVEQRRVAVLLADQMGAALGSEPR